MGHSRRRLSHGNRRKASFGSLFGIWLLRDVHATLSEGRNLSLGHLGQISRQS
jgi:hypothetical protein